MGRHWAWGTIGLLIAKGIHDVNNNGRWIRDGVGLPICGHAHLLSFQSAGESTKRSHNLCIGYGKKFCGIIYYFHPNVTEESVCRFMCPAVPFRWLIGSLGLAAGVVP